MAVINWTHRSVNDLKNIAEFIEKDSVKYASLTIQRLMNAVYLLEENSRIGRKVPEVGHKDKIREIIQGNYRIIYQIANEDLINILTVHHSSRKLTKSRVLRKWFTGANRSVYVIGAPWRDNRVTKEEGLVAGATACPGYRRGLPPGVTVFANARINK